MKIAFILVFIVSLGQLTFAEEEVAKISYYPSSPGSYSELTIGVATFTSVSGSDNCPAGYEIFLVRWKAKECSSGLKIPEINRCTPEKFVWFNSQIPRCQYCIEEKEKYGIYPANDYRPYCKKWAECVPSEKAYTICVREP